MVVVLIFAIFIKNCLTNLIMIKKFKKYNGGEISFGVEVLLVVVGIFIIWILMGGAKKPVDKPFIKPLTDQTNPGATYGPNDTLK